MTNLSLYVDGMAGSHIGVVSKEMRDLAVALNVCVTTHFNGIHVFCFPYSEENYVERMYNLALKRGEKSRVDSLVEDINNLDEDETINLSKKSAKILVNEIMKVRRDRDE